LLKSLVKFPLRRSNTDRRPELSIVVVIYNIPREAPRSLLSLSAGYQRHVDPEDYEVVVVDNGSTPPVDQNFLASLPGNFRLIRVENASPSPAKAVNLGIDAARGAVIGVMIDGARLASPGLLHFARQGARLYPKSVVATLGWYLGSDSRQQWAADTGYDQTREDRLLQSIDWPADGYRLFEIAALDGSSVHGWTSSIAESNALFLSRDRWQALKGMDERFDAAGGGLLNLDTFRRAVEQPQSRLVILLGEGTFHQLHGGVATGATLDSFPDLFDTWCAQYEAIRGEPWQLPRPRAAPTYLGALPKPVLVHFLNTALVPLRGAADSALGASFDRELWSLSEVVRPAEPTIARVVDLAHREFRAGNFEASTALARLARARAPAEPEPQRLLSFASRFLMERQPLPQFQPRLHLALGEAHAILGEDRLAEKEFRSALVWDPNATEAHFGLSQLRMPGKSYLEILGRLQTDLAPAIYLEIGIAKGDSLALARPPTLAIGVDPQASVSSIIQTETRIFPETSDEFFAKGRLGELAPTRQVDLAFIDGLHVFEQALRDFINLERACGPRSLIVMHDTVPLDEITQNRDRRTAFYTGDVWKILLCLKHYRPDLDIFTMATWPSGLTFVAGLDPTSRVLTSVYDEAIRRFIETPYSEIEDGMEQALNIVPNDWDIVTDRLRMHGILRVARDVPAN